MRNQQFAWFITIFTLSLAAGLAAGRSVRAAIPTPPPETPTAAPTNEWVYAQPAPPSSLDELLAPAQSSTPTPQAAVEAEPKSLPAASPALTQQNVLIIQVDQLSAPHLESIWLAIFVPKMSQVMIVPVYPLAAQTGANWEPLRQAGLLTTIVDPYGKISAELYGLLKAVGLEWNHYLVIDQAALVGIIERVAGPQSPASAAGMPALDAVQVVASIDAAQDNPQAYSLAQAWLYGEICTRLAHPGVPVEQVLTLEQVLSSNLVTDFALEAYDSFLANARQAGGLKCEFPSPGAHP